MTSRQTALFPGVGRLRVDAVTRVPKDPQELLRVAEERTSRYLRLAKETRKGDSGDRQEHAGRPD